MGSPMKLRQRLLSDFFTRALAASAFGSLTVVGQPAFAFKLNTHAKLAEIVYEDAKDGQVTIRIYVEPGSKAAKDKTLKQVRTFAEIRAGIKHECEESDTNKPKVTNGPA